MDWARLSGVSGRWPWIGALGLAAGCIGFSVWIYTRQRRAVPRVWWGVMAALRIALLVAICLSLLQPTAVRRQNSEDGGIAILIDRSRSMSAIDTRDNPAEQVAAAAALNLFPARLRDEKLMALQDAAARLIPLLDETERTFAERQYVQLTEGASGVQADHFLDLQRRWRIAVLALGNDPTGVSLIDLVNHFDQPAWPERAKKKIDELMAHLGAQQRASDTNLYSQDAAVREACEELMRMTRLERAREAVSGVITQIPASVPIYGAF